MNKKLLIIICTLICLMLAGCKQSAQPQIQAPNSQEEGGECVKDELSELCMRKLIAKEMMISDDRIPESICRMFDQEKISAYHFTDDTGTVIGYILIAESSGEDESSVSMEFEHLAQERKKEIDTSTDDIAVVSNYNGYWILAVGDDSRDIAYKFSVIMNRPEKVQSTQHLVELICEPLDPILYLSKTEEGDYQ